MGEGVVGKVAKWLLAAVCCLGFGLSAALAGPIVSIQDGKIEGIGRGGKALRREMSARELAGFAGARARKGKLIEPRVREARLSLPAPRAGGS